MSPQMLQKDMLAVNFFSFLISLICFVTTNLELWIDPYLILLLLILRSILLFQLVGLLIVCRLLVLAVSSH